MAIRFEPAENLAQILGDRVHLQQVMMNLVLNGFEAMVTDADDKRSLTVRTQNGDNETVRIAVFDSGTGIPADISEKLFEPFCTTKKRGLGMGLSITRTIVEAHEGRVWAENNAGAGATFHLEFPAYKERPARRSKPITAPVDEQPPSGQHAA